MNLTNNLWVFHFVKLQGMYVEVTRCLPSLLYNPRYGANINYELLYLDILQCKSLYLKIFLQKAGIQRKFNSKERIQLAYVAYILRLFDLKTLSLLRHNSCTHTFTCHKYPHIIHPSQDKINVQPVVFVNDVKKPTSFLATDRMQLFIIMRLP